MLAASASAQAGITIPAGDWTLDVGGVVNAYYTSTRNTGTPTGLALGNDTGTKTSNNITTGLLPNYLSVSGKSRQNDLDIAFTISIQPGASTSNSGIQGGTGSGDTPRANQENRQAFLTVGDASWGSVKLGKDLGIFASDAILNDMTLLGVGSGAGALAGNTTTLGHIGTGYIYADWKAQVAYTSPNWNGFQFTAGVTQAWNTTDTWGLDGATSTGRGGSQPAFEGKASYSWTGDVAGKVWVSGISQKVQGLLANDGVTDLGTDRATGWDLGANVNVAGFGLTGYYGKGNGLGTTTQLRSGFDNLGKKRDSKDWYVQATYVLPTATKVGVSYGKSKLDGTSADTFNSFENKMWTVGAYHPLTKSLNLVAEYNDVKGELDSQDGKAKTVSLGAILFF